MNEQSAQCEGMIRVEKSTIEIVDESGNPLPMYFGYDQAWVEGLPGMEYQIRLKHPRKNGPGIHGISLRACFVVSVDGLSIMDGKPASFNSGGYVLEPGESVDIPGWRVDQSAVAKFVFGSAESSYANKMMTPENIGIIGCAIYLERTGNAPRPKSVFRSASMGTGFGDESAFRTENALFVRQDGPWKVLTIRYEDGKTLERIGVKPSIARKLNAFPVDEVITGCKPPLGWKRVSE